MVVLPAAAVGIVQDIEAEAKEQWQKLNLQQLAS